MVFKQYLNSLYGHSKHQIRERYPSLIIVDLNELFFVTSSIGEKIKKSSEISECFKKIGSHFHFCPSASRAFMHEVGEFYNQPP